MRHQDLERLGNRQPEDPRLPAELSLEELMRGEGRGDCSEMYETALLDRLRELSAVAAFQGLDPVESVLENLPGYDRLATRRVLPNNRLDAGDGAAHYSVVIEAPDTFVQERYVLSYLYPPPGHRSPIVDAEDGRAYAVWQSEKPVFIDSSASLPRLYPGIGDGVSDEAALESWEAANPGEGDYERRLEGYWHLTRAIEYRVRMNFLEEMSIIDVHGEDGLARLYPRGDSEPDSWVADDDPDPVDTVMAFKPNHRDDARTEPFDERRFDPSTGEISIRRDCVEALALAGIMEGRFTQAGVLCSPDVVLIEPGGGALLQLYPPWKEEEYLDYMLLDEVREEPPGPDPLSTGITGKHRPLMGLADVVPAQEPVHVMIHAADTCLLAHQRVRELERRLADERIPERRKAVLRRELAEMEDWRAGALERLGTDNVQIAGLIASMGKEREILFQTLAAIRDGSGGLDDGVRACIESGMRSIQRYREAGSGYYG